MKTEYDGTTRATSYNEAGQLRSKARARFPQCFGNIRKSPRGEWYVRLGSYTDPRFKGGITIWTIADLDAIPPLTEEQLGAMAARRA